MTEFRNNYNKCKNCLVELKNKYFKYCLQCSRKLNLCNHTYTTKSEICKICNREKIYKTIEFCEPCNTDRLREYDVCHTCFVWRIDKNCFVCNTNIIKKNCFCGKIIKTYDERCNICQDIVTKSDFVCKDHRAYLDKSYEWFKN